MTLTINLPQATTDRVRAEAEARGTDVEAFVKEAVEIRLLRPRRTLAEVLKPMHDAVDASGMTPEQVETLIEDEVQAYQAERRRQAKS